MSKDKTPNPNLDRYKEACTYPGKLDADKVELFLQQYLDCLKIKRNIVQIKAPWKLADYPSLERTIKALLVDVAKKTTDKQLPVSLDDVAALKKFAQWCIYRGGWWWGWDLSWLS